MDEYLKTKEEIVKHFDVNLGLIAKAERIIAIMAMWKQSGNWSDDSWAMRNYKGVDRIDIGKEKESIVATVVIPQYRGCEPDTWEIEIPIEYFNMTEEEIDREEEHYCGIRIEAFRKEAKRRVEEEERQKKICAEEKEKRERELYKKSARERCDPLGLPYESRWIYLDCKYN